MRGVFCDFILVFALFDILDIVNAIFRKVFGVRG